TGADRRQVRRDQSKVGRNLVAAWLPGRSRSPSGSSLTLKTGGWAMRIDGTAFGEITIGGKTYDHDVVVRLSGEVVKRKKKLSKKLYGTSHIVSKDEAKFVFEKGCEQL